MFSSVTVSNFMRIDEPTEVPLDRVTILVGANGSGKSSILKAIHWSIRCASLRIGDKTTLEQMDFVPSRDFLELAHKKRLQNPETAPKFSILFNKPDLIERSIAISAARNDAGVKSKLTGPLDELLDAENPKTAYIPGLAGLAETETVLASPVLRRKAASGDGGSVLRHILLDLADSAGNCPSFTELTELNHWVSKVIPGARFWVKFDRQRDVIIRSEFTTKDLTGERTSRKPLEMAGTGFLQVVQIFAYLLRYKPRLILVDEPDAHLHPGTQELLIRAIEKATIAFPETQFIITSHSPTFVRASSPSTKIVWMEDGRVKDFDSEKVRKRMGWSALDKKLMIITEDANLQYIKNIISQWPDIERNVLISPSFGKDNIPNGQKVIKIREELGVKVLIHRDRDFMSDEQIAIWKTQRDFDKHDVPVWLPPGSDIESCFLNVQHLSATLGIDPAAAIDLINVAIDRMDEKTVSDNFVAAFSAATAKLPKEHSNTIKRWSDLGGKCPATVRGYELLEALKKLARDEPERGIDLERVKRIHTAHPSTELCTDLRDLCRGLLFP